MKVTSYNSLDILRLLTAFDLEPTQEKALYILSVAKSLSKTELDLLFNPNMDEYIHVVRIQEAAHRYGWQM